MAPVRGYDDIEAAMKRVDAETGIGQSFATERIEAFLLAHDLDPHAVARHAIEHAHLVDEHNIGGVPSRDLHVFVSSLFCIGLGLGLLLEGERHAT